MVCHTPVAMPYGTFDPRVVPAGPYTGPPSYGGLTSVGAGQHRGLGCGQARYMPVPPNGGLPNNGAGQHSGLGYDQIPYMSDPTDY